MAISTSSLEWITLLDGQLPSRREIWGPNKTKISHTPVVAYRHQANGQVERMIQSLKQTVKKLVAVGKESWDEVLWHALLTVRTTTNRAIGKSPAELVYGKRLMTPAIWGNESITSLESLEGTVFDETDWLNKLVTFRKQAYEQSDKNKKALVQTYQPKQGLRQFEVGEKVLYYKGTTDSGFGPIADGPYEVTRSLGSGIYEITDGKGGKIPSSADRLKKYLEPYEGTRVIRTQPLKDTVPKNPPRMELKK
ncbi:Transposon Ty3-G Gag-Pol polyprotein [Smittium culicis]|uniref:Transposon Ty3-G Gag-Pol polyprotein n=1 Tax=Smittium culicis TaxID=133412 RepID=A0A1R1YJF3_9FUNG|nr:Transposon Ty3-G Gag-Pol polyprotein [Smittium culicis]